MKLNATKIALAVIAVVGMITTIGCKKGEGEGKEFDSNCLIIEDCHIEEVNISLLDCLSSIAQPQQLVIINSQAEYDSLFPSCPLSTNIDFESETLYAVHGYTPSCIISEDISALCDGENISITIDITTGDCTSAEKWVKVFTSNKVEENQTISLTINLISP